MKPKKWKKKKAVILRNVQGLGSRQSGSLMSGFGSLRWTILATCVFGIVMGALLLWPQSAAAAKESVPAPLNPLAMGIGLLGGLALFLYGMEKMTDGLKAAAGEQMKVLLTKLTRKPVEEFAWVDRFEGEPIV